MELDIVMNNTLAKKVPVKGGHKAKSRHLNLSILLSTSNLYQKNNFSVKNVPHRCRYEKRSFGPNSVFLIGNSVMWESGREYRQI